MTRLLEVGFEGVGIITKDVAVVALSYSDITVSGHARRDPRDKPNPELGEKLALGRALSALGNRLQRQARGEIKHADDMATSRERARARDRAQRTVEHADHVRMARA